MTTEERREQLLSAGVELLRQRRHEDVSIEEIAETAGVSTGLLYHYFPTKKAFVVAALERGQEQLARQLEPDPDLDPVPRLDASLDAFLDSVEEHVPAYTAIFKRGGGDSEVTATIGKGREQQLQMLIQAMRSLDEPAIDVTPTLEAALQGWLYFCEGAVLRWLEHGGIDRDRLRLLLRSALIGSVSAAAVAERGQRPPSTHVTTRS